jgi:hypothetical protein
MPKPWRPMAEFNPSKPAPVQHVCGADAYLPPSIA